MNRDFYKAWLATYTILGIGCFNEVAAQTSPSFSTPSSAVETFDEFKADQIRDLTRPSPFIKVKREAEPLTADGPSIAFMVNKILITGNTVVKLEELAPLLQSYEGRELTFKDLKTLSLSISSYYQDRGYFLAHAFVPPQDVVNGQVEIKISEGKLGKVVVEFKENTGRMSEDRIRSYVSSAIRNGDVVQLKKLDHQLMQLNDLSGIKVHAAIVPGTEAGTSEIILKVKEKRPYNISFSADNFGDQYIGKYHGHLRLTLHSPLGVGDKLKLDAISTGSRMFFGNASYILPVNRQGTKASFNYGSMNYKLGATLAPLMAKGDAKIFDTMLSHPLMRTRTFALTALASYENRNIYNKTLFGTSNNKKIYSGSIGFNLHHQDGWMGGGVNSLELMATTGQLNLKKWQPDYLNDQTTAQTAGHFSKYNYNVNRLQKLTKNTGLFLRVEGQLASKNLEPSEKTRLGSPFGVRAYPMGEGTGDEGYVATAEMQYDLPPSTFFENPKFLTFFDTGWVRVNKKPWGDWNASNPNLRNHYYLYGLGVGLSVDTKDLKVMTSYGFKIGKNPNRDVNGNDVNNHHSIGTFWLQVIKTF